MEERLSAKTVRVVYMRMPPAEPDVLLVLERGGIRLQAKDGSVFITRREWKMPGGKSEGTEDFETALMREFLEETGWELPMEHFHKSRYIEDMNESPQARGRPYRQRTYLALVTDAPPLLVRSHFFAKGDVEMAQWFPLGTLPLTLEVPGACGAALEAEGKNRWRLRQLLHKYKKVLLRAGCDKKALMDAIGARPSDVPLYSFPR